MNTKKTVRTLALDLLSRSTCSVQVAAVLTDRKGVIFSWGWNHVAVGGSGNHAELHAITRANKKRLYGATITIAARRRKNGHILNSRPCEIVQPTQRVAGNVPCMELLKKHGIAKIEHTTRDGWVALTLKYTRVM